MGMQYYGTKGCAEARYDAPVRISGETNWEFPGLGKPPATDQAAAVTGAFQGALEDADPNKQKAFIESITSGNLAQRGGPGAESALAGILGRMAAYTGKPGHLGRDDEVQGGLGPEDGLEPVRLSRSPGRVAVAVTRPSSVGPRGSIRPSYRLAPRGSRSMRRK